MAKESSLWKWLSEARKEFRHDLHMCRVENSIMRGMPDVEGQLTGHRQFWIELKVAARPTKPETPVHFKVRPEQVEWLNHRYKAGGNAWLLIMVGSGYNRALYLVRGFNAAELKQGVTEERLKELNVLEPNPKASDVVRRAAER